MSFKSVVKRDEPSLGHVYIINPGARAADLFVDIVEQAAGAVPKDEVNERAVLLREPPLKNLITD